MTTEAMRRLLNHLILGTRGGYARARIIEAVKAGPLNAHQLSQKLGYDYSTIRHHLDVLTENALLTVSGDKYGQIYSIGPELESSYEMFLHMWEKASAGLKR